MNDNYDEILEVLFSGYMRNFTMVFNQIKGSKYGKGCGAVNNILEYEGQLCFIPSGDACFKKCSEFFKKDFSKGYKEFVLGSDRCKITTKLAKVQPFCMEHGLDNCVCKLNSKRLIPPTVKQKKTGCIHTKTISVYFGK